MVNVETETSFYGIIYSACRSKVISIDPVLKFEKETHFSGQIYWDGIFNISGHVNGSIACKKFLLRTPSSIYENHLMDITIDLDSLSKHYTGIDLTPSEKIKTIIKWLP
jgi:hypothetical protein